MKKKIISIALVVAMIAIIAAGSFAYFTDTKQADNTFTVGNVKIELLESQLHRVNAGVANGQTSTSELWTDATMNGAAGTAPTGWEKAWFTDDQIKADAAEYDCTDIKLNPGQSYHKMPYVVNTGANDAYVRIRVLFPAALDTAILNSSMYTESATTYGEFTAPERIENYATIDGVVYNAYEFTRTSALAPNEMTFWNVWGTVHMDSDVNNDELSTLCPDGKFAVLVQADAIQADGFDSVDAAWAAFDAQK